MVCHCFCFQDQTHESGALRWRNIFPCCAEHYSSFREMYAVLGVDLALGLLIHCILLWDWHWRLHVLLQNSFNSPLLWVLIVWHVMCYYANTMASIFLSGFPINGLLLMWLSNPWMPYIESALVWFPSLFLFYILFLHLYSYSISFVSFHQPGHLTGFLESRELALDFGAFDLCSFVMLQLWLSSLGSHLY